MVNLLVPWVMPEPRDKESLLPQEISHYLILCQDPGGSLTSERLAPPPSGLWQILAPRPPWRSHPSQRHFYCCCLPMTYPFPRPEGIQMLCACKEMKSACPPGCRILGRLRECRWKREVGKSRAFSQSHGRSEDHWWPMPLLSGIGSVLLDPLSLWGSSIRSVLRAIEILRRRRSYWEQVLGI